MSLTEGLQSVAFYVLSCSTCSKISHRRKAKAQAKRERAEKHALESEQPGLYRHPSPFSTNPFWEEEIQLGPTPLKKKGNQSSGNKLLTTTSLNGLESMNSNENTSTVAASSLTMIDGKRRSSRDDWDVRRYQRGYQREDEDLWGRGDPGPESPGTGQRIRDVFVRAGSTVGERLSALEGRLNKNTKEEDSRSPYFVARNPPVNDLHPPVVSTAPPNRKATKWMLQPPPSAKVMEGKERANRSRSVSQGSSTRDADNPSAVNLSRQITGRAIAERWRRGETPEMDESQATLCRTQSYVIAPLRPHIATVDSYDNLNSKHTTLARRRWRSSSFSSSAKRRLSIDSIEDNTVHNQTTNNQSRTPLRSIESPFPVVPIRDFCMKAGRDVNLMGTSIAHTERLASLDRREGDDVPCPSVSVPGTSAAQQISQHILPLARNAISTTLMLEAPTSDKISPTCSKFIPEDQSQMRSVVDEHTVRAMNDKM